MKRYLTFDEYNGSLVGLQPMPAGSHDVASPGGLSSQSTHWTHGLFGRPDTHSDVMYGEGERYVYGNYGNMYVPNSHAAIYSLYQGPSTAQTEYRTLIGEPYYWENMGHNNGGYGEKKTLPHAYTPINQSDVPVNNNRIEKFVPNLEKQPLPTSVELIEPIEELPSKSKKEVIPLKPIVPAASYISTDDTGLSLGKKLSLASLVLIVIVFVTLEFWAETVHSFTKQYLNKGVDPSWIKYLSYALIASIVLVIFLMLI